MTYEPDKEFVIESDCCRYVMRGPNKLEVSKKAHRQAASLKQKVNKITEVTEPMKIVLDLVSNTQARWNLHARLEDALGKDLDDVGDTIEHFCSGTDETLVITNHETLAKLVERIAKRG